MLKKYQIYLWLLFIVLIGLVIYYPGLSGGYMMDDKSNLSSLSIFNGEISWEKIKEYMGLSKSGDLKRPISILSFLIDTNKWPTSAWSFKRTNLIIHISNGILLFILYFKIFHNSKKLEKDALFIAVIGTSLWMMHPFLVSSVLYIVQRMTLLATTFVLLGLIFYTIGRIKYEESIGKKGLLSMLLGMYIMPIFAVLSKENGILLVYYIILLEFFIFRKSFNYHAIKSNLRFLIYSPPILTSIGLLYKLPGFIQSYDIRIFSLYERVLTEFRVITAYLYNIFLPKYISQGAYTDGYAISKGLFDPSTTFTSIILVISLFILALIIRKKYALISFSILFFFIAHILESTVIPLELYYEHRNYIPMLFIFLPVVLLFNNLRKKSKLYYLPVFSIIVLFSFITFLKANLWGDNFKLHQVTMNKYPSSTRVITMMAIQYEKKHDLVNSYKTLINGMKINNAFEIKINYLNMLCSRKLLKEQHLSALYQDSISTPLTRNSLPPYNVLFNNIIEDNCGLGEPIKFAKMLLHVMENNSFESQMERKPMLFMFKAQIEFRLDNFNQSVDLFLQSFHWKHDFNNIFFVASDLMANKQMTLAQKVVNEGWLAYQQDYKYAIDWFNYQKAFIAIKNDIKTLLDEEL